MLALYAVNCQLWLLNFLLVHLCLTHVLSDGLIVEALAAQGLVNVLATDDLQGLRGAGTEGEGSVLIANLADRLQFLHFLGLGDKLEDALETGP